MRVTFEHRRRGGGGDDDMVFEIYDQTPAVDTCLSSDQQQKIKKKFILLRNTE